MVSDSNIHHFTSRISRLSYSGITYLLCRAARGEGDFDQTLASQAFTLHIPICIFMWIPGTFLAPILIASGIYTLPWPEWAEILRIFVFPFAWMFVISTIVLSGIHRIPWWKNVITIIRNCYARGNKQAFVFILHYYSGFTASKSSGIRHKSKCSRPNTPPSGLTYRM